jgi:uncharacterized protein
MLFRFSFTNVLIGRRPSAGGRFAWTATAALLLSASVLMPAGAQTLSERVNKGLVEVVTGRTDSTAARIAADLANVLDDGATRRVLPVIGKGSLQNLTDLRALRGVDIAIVQSDVLAHARSRKLYPGIENAITYIAKLHNEEFHLLAGEGIRSVEDLAGKKVNFDTAGSGTAVTGPLIFERLGVKVEPTSFDQGLALEKLKSGEIAAMAYVVGKPSPLFAMQKPGEGFHFLPVPLAPALMDTYLPASLRKEDYPALVTGDAVETVAVGTVMAVAHLAPNTERYRNVANFVDAFFTQFPKLLEPSRSPKWQEVNLAAELPGWRRFPAADEWLKRNGGGGPVLTEVQLRDVFGQFLDERSRVTRGAALPQQRKEELFEQFRRWQASQNR